MTRLFRDFIDSSSKDLDSLPDEFAAEFYDRFKVYPDEFSDIRITRSSLYNFKITFDSVPGLILNIVKKTGIRGVYVLMTYTLPDGTTDSLAYEQDRIKLLQLLQESGAM